MGDAERRAIPPPLPKKKPKLIDRMVRETPSDDDELQELTDADILPDEDAEELFEIDIEEVTDGSPEAGKETKERERHERQTLLDALATRGLKTEAALEVVAAYDPKLLKDERFVGEMSAIAASYGVKFDRMSPEDQEKFTVMYLGVKNGRIDANKTDVAEALEGGIKEQLVGQAFRNIDALQAGLEQAAGDPEQLKGNLRETMATLNALSKQLPWTDKANAETWQNLYNRFNILRAAKKGSREIGQEVESAFSEVFEEFGGFIEDEIVDYRLKHGGGSIEDITREMYGRTPAEMEKIKVRNREAVAEAIGRMKEKPGIDIDMLEELHALNNKGIVPKKFSKMREDPDAVSYFGKGRLGLMGPDVKPQVEAMLERANTLIDRDAIGDVSKLRYEIEAAGLHNDLLDMHPFGDRNGSTSLLFLELMMARKGYEPPKDRQPNYYKHLSAVVGYNPIAVAVVGHEQYKIAHVTGYYEGPGMTAEQKEYYDKVLEWVKRLKRKQSGKA